MRAALIAASIGVLIGCGGSSSSPSGTPSISFTAPASSASVALGTDANKSVAVSFTTSNFTVQAPGSCPNATNCGHVHLLIDSSSTCTSGSLGYNAEFDATSGNANFSLCSTPTGAHMLILELHDDHHNPVKVNGAVVSTSENITTH
jgi:hypothetical protein